MTGLFSLDGKTALITGSSRGIGYAIALEMARAGADVVISSRKQDACDEAAEQINALVGRPAATAFAASLSDRAAMTGLVGHATGRRGQIDILVCNAASNPYYGPMTEVPDAAFHKILENNVIANNWLVAQAAPGMRANGGGAVIIVSSIGGLVGSPVIGAYNVSKAADMQLARNLAVELGPDNIRVNCIAPGLIKTEFSRALWENPETYDTFMRTTPLKRLGDPADIAGAAVFLAAPAGAFVTGQTIVADGGTTIQGV